MIWATVSSHLVFPDCIELLQVYAPTSNVEEADVEQFYDDLQDLIEVTPKKDVLFIIGDWNAKVGVKKHQGEHKFSLGVQKEAVQRRSAKRTHWS